MSGRLLRCCKAMVHENELARQFESMNHQIDPSDQRPKDEVPADFNAIDVLVDLLSA